MNTPLYVFSKEELRKNYKKISSLLVNVRICYTLKTNAEKEVLNVLAEEGASFECASIGEYNRILELGVLPERTIFGLPIKPEETITNVYENAGRYFVFEELRELEKLNRLAPDAKKILRIYVSDIAKETIDFGMPLEQIFTENNDWLQYVDGLSFHISHNTDLEVYCRVCERVEQILRKLNEICEKKYIVNIGGGFHLDAGQEFFDGVVKTNEELRAKYDIDIYAEPGECIVGTAGKFYTSVVAVRKNGRTYEVYMDSGLPQGVATRRNPSSVSIYNNDRKAEKRRVYRFMDCTCLGTALFMKRTDLDIQEGDILEMEGCGAYTTVFCNDFHSYEKCPVICK